MRTAPAVLLAASILPAVAQAPSTRFQPLLNNNYVDVTGLDLPPGRQAAVYQNTRDVFWIALNQGSLTFVATGGTKSSIQFHPGDTRFFRRNQVRSAVNESDTAVRSVVVEIKRPGMTSSACYCTDKVESALCGCGAPRHLPPMWATGMGKIMVGSTVLAAEESYQRTAHRGDALLVALTPVRLLDEAGEAAAIDLKAGEVAWVNAGRHKFKNTAAAPARFVSFEF